MYGLPKIHKNNSPLRPIVSNIQAHTYNMAKFLGNSISKILGESEYHTKDSWQFQNFIQKQKVPSNHKIISLDVESLYTNIPTDLALEITESKWNKLSPHTPLTKNEFIKVRLMVSPWVRH